MNVAPRPKPKVKLTLKEFEELDAPKKGVKSLFHRVFHLTMRWKIKEMLREEEMEEGELRAYKRAKELGSIRRRTAYHAVYLGLCPLSGVLCARKAYDAFLHHDNWAFFWAAAVVFWWLRQLPKDWKSFKELRRRRMELLVEEIHDR